jgi:Na+/H+ antiporter NhaD/arsenite permease-like protein
VTAAAIFLATYGVLAIGRVPFLRLNRTGAAILGGILMVATGVIGFDEAVREIDYRTITLLFGMMVIVAYMRLAGGLGALVRFVSMRVVHPAALLVVLIAASGLLSALFVNDTICLVFTPIVIDLAAARGQRPLPYLLALATSANIGSVAAITGNPQNMLIGSLSGLSFLTFSAALLPVALVGLALDALFLCWVFRRELGRATGGARTALPDVPVDRPMLMKTVVVTGGVLAGLLAGYDTALVGAGGAAVLLLVGRVDPRAIRSAIDWELLALFVGLFVVVGGAERAGLDRRIFEWLSPVGVQTVAGLSVSAAILSNLVSNVPAVMLFTGVVPRLPDPQQAWLTLAMASTLAGNLTILGSIANLIVVEGAGRRGVTVTFFDYARVGVPITIATTAAGIWWLS